MPGVLLFIVSLLGYSYLITSGLHVHVSQTDSCASSSGLSFPAQRSFPAHYSPPEICFPFSLIQSNTTH